MEWSEIYRSKALSVPDRLSVDLERLILHGELLPGTKLPAERDLADELGVSRASVRAALRELENRGLVDRKPGRGTIILHPKDSVADADLVLDTLAFRRSELRDIMQLRSIIEPPIARITAQKASQRDIAQLEELVLAMETDVDPETYAELDRAFHQSIAQYTHNPLLALINEQIGVQVSPSRASRYQTEERRRSSSEAHRKIFEAIARADGDAAELAAREHVRDISKRIAETDEQIIARLGLISNG